MPFWVFLKVLTVAFAIYLPLLLFFAWIDMRWLAPSYIDVVLLILVYWIARRVYSGNEREEDNEQT